MSDIASRFVWKLARRHSWGSPIPAEELIRLVARTEDYDEIARVLEEEVLSLPFVVRSVDGIQIPNGQDAHIATADWLREHTEFNNFTIKAILSRLPEDWPQGQ